MVRSADRIDRQTLRGQRGGARPRRGLDRRPDRNVELGAQLRHHVQRRQLRAGDEQGLALRRHRAQRQVEHLLLGDAAEFRRGLAVEAVQRLDLDAGRFEIAAQAVVHRRQIRRHHRRAGNAFAAQGVHHGAGRAHHGRVRARAQLVHHAGIAGGAAEKAGRRAAIDHQIELPIGKRLDGDQGRFAVRRQILEQQRARRALHARDRNWRQRGTERGNLRLHRGVVFRHHDQGLDVSPHEILGLTDRRQQFT